MALRSGHGDCKESPAWILRGLGFFKKNPKREKCFYSDFEGKEKGKAGLDLIQRLGDLALTTAPLGAFPSVPQLSRDCYSLAQSSLPFFTWWPGCA